MRKFRHTKKSPVILTKDDNMAVAFYLYTIFKDLPNQVVLDSIDDIFPILSSCIKLQRKEQRFSAVLKNQISILEKQGRLVPFEDSEVHTFSTSDICLKYEQDKKVAQFIENTDEICENYINLLRILFTANQKIFSTIINTVIFDESKNLTLIKNFAPSLETKKSIFDISEMNFFMNQAGLSKDETRFILMLYRLENINGLSDFISRYEETFSIKNCFSNMLGISKQKLKQILRADQKIKSFGFVDESNELNDDLIECIEAKSIDPYFSDFLKPIDCAHSYKLNSFSVKEESQEIILDFLKGKNSVSILFYGKPGSGKTELAKSLCKESDKNAYIFKNEAELNNKNNMNVLLKLNCLLSMEKSNSVIIIDEADSLLQTQDLSLFGIKMPAKSKGIVNKMLENNKDKVIWIVNHTNQIDESTRRRFAYSVKFDSMPAATLRSIAQSKLRKIAIPENSKSKILDLFDKYQLTGTSVDNVANALSEIKSENENELLQKTENIMKENSLLLYGKLQRNLNIGESYEPSAINTSISEEKIIEMVKNAACYNEENPENKSGIRMLFYGLSGTGKTAFARYISKELKKEIIIKKASDIFSPFIGMNEKNIANAFREAENANAILVFDEADSFFPRREKTNFNWERNVVNEFLTQMEDFSGILICTTNLKNIMDSAMQRRFHIMLEFKPLENNGIKTLLKKYFSNFDFSEKQIAELENFKTVTPGDFGTLSARIRFMNPKDISSEYIFAELKKIQEEKKSTWADEYNSNRIGFTA